MGTIEHRIGRLGEKRDHRLPLTGRFGHQDAGRVWTDLKHQTAGLSRGDHLEIDLGDVEVIDGTTTALLVHLRGTLAARGVTSELTNARPAVETLIHLYDGDADPLPKRRRHAEGFLAQVGRSTVELVHGARDVLGFLGDVVRSTAGLIRDPRTGNWKHVFPTMERVGTDAVPIIILINFLVGFVMAYQSAAQLEQFGASIFIADLIGGAMTREMAPLMTAIILCGRSGAAFAAELGSMKVSEEIDALRTMGFGAIRYLVLPRMLAMVLVIPILTLIADFVGIMGGYVVATQRLDLSGTHYFHQLQESLHVWDVLTGLIKACAFGLTIALVSCQQGFQATGGAEGVGRRTTASVVQVLIMLIVLDAGFTILFGVYGV
jgi:phospholipid/cholesterol/gamma-HCH transport system permease protein